jgi:hypothetical protein
MAEYRLPTGNAARQASAAVVGADGWDLLGALEAPAAPDWLRILPAVQRVRRVWAQQYHPRESGGQGRQAEEVPPAGQVQNSPYDPDARYGKNPLRQEAGDGLGRGQGASDRDG